MHFSRAMRRPRRTAPLLPLAPLLLLLLCAAAGCLAAAPAGVAQGEKASQEPRQDEGTSDTPKGPEGGDKQLSADGTQSGSGAGPEKRDTVTAPQSPDRSENGEQKPAMTPAPAPQADGKAVLTKANAQSEEARRGGDAGSLSPRVKGEVEVKDPGQERSQEDQVQVVKEEGHGQQKDEKVEVPQNTKEGGETLPSTTQSVGGEGAGQRQVDAQHATGGIPAATTLPPPSVSNPAAGSPAAQSSGDGAGTGATHPDVADAPRGSAGEKTVQGTANKADRNTATKTDSKQGSGVAGVSPTPGDSATVRDPQGTRAESAPLRPAGEPEAVPEAPRATKTPPEAKENGSSTGTQQKPGEAAVTAGSASAGGVAAQGASSPSSPSGGAPASSNAEGPTEKTPEAVQTSEGAPTQEEGDQQRETAAGSARDKAPAAEASTNTTDAATPAAGGAGAATPPATTATKAEKPAPGDSDGSSAAASHSASPLALLLLACAAAAAMLAA
ncbi:uncharacterized protein Tco025E_10200 [Trypanosoma conorhini]|uniref:Mucin-associated surface protein (MASP) n=1 Tax=Trypanosoma conorhini TaxID=83891 RepID=A0A3R7LWR3_9TRYP|nr:uncharacterized protein Tco025E_10200 [Trypanosoma conorhini]RNE95078.1 hypothetical protein Tco025E_10200 [Trypanosoma conorhini]